MCYTKQNFRFSEGFGFCAGKACTMRNTCARFLSYQERAKAGMSVKADDECRANDKYIPISIQTATEEDGEPKCSAAMNESIEFCHIPENEKED